MTARLRAWWQTARKHPLVIGLFVFVVLSVLILLGYRLNWLWTGFSNKTLWDWLNLLGVLAIPAVVALGAAWYTGQQAKVSDRENTDNQRETALQSYIDKMSELLLKEHLGERTADGQLDPEYEQVRKIARVRTITVLTQLDPRRVGYVFTFLREAGLMSTTSNDSAVSLSDANLQSVNWSQAFLLQANLTGAFLVGANLTGANLRRANLIGANLYGAILRRAILVGADLSGAILIGADLKETVGVTVEELEKQALSITDATMPDGSKHETSFTRKEIISLLQKAGSPDKLDLSGCDLAGINLSRLNLSGADLHGAKLIFSGLHGTDLSGANLKGANLSSARGTTSEQLDKAGSLKDTVMPDGSIHP
jgi:uncharacterized protein YjbI with pentapeptide repeats